MQVALVTGATRGIGRAILQKFIDEGIFVIGTYAKSKSQAESVQKEFGLENCKFIQFDQGNLESHQSLISQITKIDILVNNAGIGSKTVEYLSDDLQKQDELLLQVNSLGPLWLTQEVLKLMEKKDSGKIINISSVGGGIFHFPGFRLADGMSKAALTFMARQLAAEYSQTGIDIFTICPGATETDMFNASTLNDMNEKEKESFINSLPKKRLIDPSEIANLCHFLTTKESQILHGAVIDSSLGLGTNPGLIG